MEDLQLFTMVTGVVVFGVCSLIAAIEGLRVRNRRIRQELREAKAENARLRSLLNLSRTEQDILTGRMAMDEEKHKAAVALMAQKAGERYATKDLLLKQRWKESVSA